MNSPLPPARPLRRRIRGFTLAEVMIAMGIVASVMVAILGLMGLAVKSIQESTNLTIAGRISQQIINNIQMAEWTDILQNYENQSFKFDNEGFPIRADDKDPPTAIFEARVIFPTDQVEVGDIKYDLRIVRRLNIQVEFTPGGVKLKNEIERQRNIKHFTYYVANQNKLGAR